MNSTRRACGGELLFAFLSGSLLAASFPKFYQPWLAWLAPGFILLATFDSTGRGTFKRGFIAGLGNYLVSLSWMLEISSPLKSIANYLVICAIQSAYLAGWCWVCWKLFPHRSDLSPEESSPLAGRFKSLGLRQKLIWPFLCAACWVGAEMCRARFHIGSTWNFLGVSQFENSSLIQMTSFTGVYGVSFIVAWMSVSLLAAVLTLWSGLRFFLRALVQLVIPGIAVAAALIFGAGRLEDSSEGLLPFRIALVQSAPSNHPEVSSGKLVELTKQALKAQPDLVVVPELASRDGSSFETVAAEVRAQHLWLVAGLGGRADDRDSLDGLVLVSPKSTPGTEPQQVFLTRESQWLGGSMPVTFFFHNGSNVVFEIQKPRVRFAPMLNGEDLIPQEARFRASGGVDFLLHLGSKRNVSASAAGWQHAANAVFRSLENGMVMVNSGSAGLSCWIDARGGINDASFTGPDETNHSGVKVLEIPLYGAAPGHPATFYQRNGDWFGWGCMGVLTLALLMRAFSKKATA